MRMSMDKSGEFPNLRILFDTFPELSARILGYIGKQAAMRLWEEHLQGQDITVNAASRGSSGSPKGESGRRLVTYSVGGNLKWVSVSSFPLNLYENRKQLRRGDAQRRGILGRKLKSGVSSRLSGFILGAENLIVDDWLNRRKKEALRGIL